VSLTAGTVSACLKGALGCCHSLQASLYTILIFQKSSDANLRQTTSLTPYRPSVPIFVTMYGSDAHSEDILNGKMSAPHEVADLLAEITKYAL
jgi:hypothetical protein